MSPGGGKRMFAGYVAVMAHRASIVRGCHSDFLFSILVARAGVRIGRVLPPTRSLYLRGSDPLPSPGVKGRGAAGLWGSGG